jgi:hypothetical protein
MRLAVDELKPPPTPAPALRELASCVRTYKKAHGQRGVWASVWGRGSVVEGMGELLRLCWDGHLKNCVQGVFFECHLKHCVCGDCRTALARSLPSSTPHWSNELMPQMAPCTNTGTATSDAVGNGPGNGKLLPRSCYREARVVSESVTTMRINS